MKYIGLQSQISSNNFKSIVLLLAFPLLLLGLVWLFFFFFYSGSTDAEISMAAIHDAFLGTIPYVIFIVAVWFLIAWFSHASLIQRATSAKPLQRKTHKRVYNLVENLCMSQGIKMPKIFIIEDTSLNAFASGLSEKTFAVTLSRGIIEKLDDDELEAVIAHELTHIINRDVRLLIVSIIFVGIFSFITELAFRSVFYRTGRSSGKKEGGAVLIVLGLGILGLILSSFFRFSLSRKREYLADAGAAEMTRKPLALANALRKISEDPWIEAVKREDIAQMFIDHPTKKKDQKSLVSFFNGMFATHPPIQKRIQILEQF
jgi:heat shock protein HtpX